MILECAGLTALFHFEFHCAESKSGVKPPRSKLNSVKMRASKLNN